MVGALVDNRITLGSAGWLKNQLKKVGMEPFEPQDVSGWEIDCELNPKP